MTTVERTALIEAAPQAIWKVLADFASISAWAPNVDHSCLLTEQEEGVGTTRRIQVGRTTLTETVRSWETGSSLSYTICGLPPIIGSVVNTWRLEPHGDGTHATLTTDIDAGVRPPRQLLARVVGRKLAAASDEMLGGLTEHFDERERT